MTGRTLVIGDLHGCHAVLRRLWDHLDPPPGPGDTVVFLGDYIDRGPESRQVIDFILGLRGAGLRVIALMGNHEQMLLEFLTGRDDYGYLQVGGAATLASYGCPPGLARGFSLPAEHHRFLLELLPYWQDDFAIYVHAGLKPGCPLALQPKDWLLWAREEFLDADGEFGKRVIYGHTPFPQPRVEPWRIGIDTGAVYGWRLTCLILPEMAFVQVPGLPIWPPPAA
ncbi:MAG: metallophosphoesterase family protein [Desulfobacteraceae bacterium]|nr:metallophosphoesterase family protein [Desulfobacteraceae bacterium]